MKNTTPELLSPLAVYREVFKDSVLKYCVTVQNGNLYFRYDTEDRTPKENWDIYIDFQEMLRVKGYEIKDPVIEHDCISGDLATCVVLSE